MTATNNLQPFDVSNPTNWDIYAEQLEYHCIANNIVDEQRKRAVLLAAMGTATFKIVKSLVSPEPLTSKTFEELVQMLRQHFVPQTSVIFKRHLFQRRVQQKDESVTSYLTELKRLSEDCEFGTTLNERLRDQLVSGLTIEGIQRQLLSETTLTFDETVKKALAGEAATAQVRELQTQFSAPPTTYKVHHQKETTVQKGSSCIGCGGSHKREQCKFKNAECHMCHKKGHIAKVCRSKPDNSVKFSKKKSVATHQLDSHSEFSIHDLNRPKQQKLKVIVHLDGQPCTMEIDSGSSYSVISHQTFKQLWKNSAPLIRKVTNLPLTDFQESNSAEGLL